MELVAWRLACAWAANGHVVRVYTTPGGTPSEVPDRVAVTELAGLPGKYSRTWLRATRDVDLSDVDVVLGVSAGARYLLRSGARRPIVMQAHGTSVDEIITKWSLRTPRAAIGSLRNFVGLLQDLRNYPRYTAVVGIGPSVSESIDRYPRWASPKRVVTIPNGIPDSTVKNDGMPRNGFLYVGRLHREKGVDLLIRSMGDVDSVLDVVGDGPERARLEHLASELRLGERVKFHGALPPPEIATMMSRTAVVVVPSRRREGLPLVVMEALAAGAHVVVSATVRATLGDDAPGGVLTWGGDRASLASVMTSAAKMEGRVVLPAEYDLRNVARRYELLFDELRGESRGG
ncbi:glycosyltransferase family 4 protein [Cellulomonas sp. ICMP 17802]|uniref:glycosyltransferase family 4 protein n=1 Tax=Cellulomonas sp. ICMP 17802 TaxID=3239199 RepID=UPI00351B7C23